MWRIEEKKREETGREERVAAVGQKVQQWQKLISAKSTMQSSQAPLLDEMPKFEWKKLSPSWPARNSQ